MNTTTLSPHETPNSKPSSLPVDPPNSLAAEAAVLGSMIQDSSVIPDVQEIIQSSEVFFHREHVLLWQMVLEVYDETKGKASDGLLVREKLASHGRLEEIGGLDYLRRVVESVPSSHSAVYYANIVNEKAVRRAILEAGRELSEAATSGDDVEELIETVSARVSKLGQQTASVRPASSMFDLLMQAYATLETDPVYSLPCPSPLSHVVRGFQPGQMIVVSGRPAHGKTSVGLWLAVEGMRHNTDKRVAFFSFEMTPADMVMRILSSETKIPYQSMNKHGMDLLPPDNAGMGGYERVLFAQQYFAKWDLRFPNVAPTPTAVSAACRKLHREKPLDCVFLDYIQRMHSAGKYQSRDREMSVISNSLKDLALELNIPFVVLAQLNRQCEQRPDHRPRISDLRESGTIEQDADVVISVFRPERYDDCPDDQKGLVELGVLKQRNGPEGRLVAGFDGPTMGVYAMCEDSGCTR